MKKIVNVHKNPTSGLSAILVTQGDHKFYIASMPSDVLSDVCYTVSREEDPVEGFQRRLDEGRAQEIAGYIDGNKGSIPTAIILSAQDEAELTYSSKTKTISFQREKQSFLIIDGQHRVWGFIKAQTSIRVPVVIYEGLSRVEEAQLFIDINTNQHEVPEALLLDVKMFLQNETEDEKRCSEVFEIFYTDDCSVLKGHMVRADRQQRKISRITFNNAISDLLKNDLKGFPAQKSFSIINNYLKAFNQILSEMETSFEDSLVKPVFFQGLVKASRYVLQKTSAKHGKLTTDAFYDVLSILKTNISRQRFTKPGNSFNRLSDSIVEALSRNQLNLSIITED